CQHFWTTPWTF
nr:immunoglobulin light chain junction region [Mus musculus]NSM00276.1 immunoglobulin light chain junction region [Mus musculus]NSM00987.1 immunoglobulin light chain junction region [Mus musculus]NSM02327.1 immunoglobulin light chain junction region [Mus musculus]